MASQKFWDKWLIVVAWFLVVFGLLLAFASQTRVFAVFNQRVNSVFWPSGTVVDDIESFQAWIFGVLGATISGWGLFAVFLARYPFRRRERWSWNCVFAGVTLWFLADTAISAYFGVVINVVFNVTLAASVYIPLFATRSQFTEHRA